MTTHDFSFFGGGGGGGGAPDVGTGTLDEGGASGSSSEADPSRGLGGGSGLEPFLRTPICASV
jgi:hypothetical protein